MGKYVTFVMGPAGSGKTTFCEGLVTMCLDLKRKMSLINLDPAADETAYNPSLDICELISVEDVAEECKLGPNASLIYCMEYLITHLDWFMKELEKCEDFMLFDCPGQIEVYSHYSILTKLANKLQDNGYHVVAVYLMDSTFLNTPQKFLSGSLIATSVAINLNIPFLSFISKFDLLKHKDKEDNLDKYLKVDTDALTESLNKNMNKKYHKLTKSLGELIFHNSLVDFQRLTVTDPLLVEVALNMIDHCLQYGEDNEL